MTSAREAMRILGKASFAAIDPDNTSYGTLHELVAELNIAVQHAPALASLVGEISLLDTLVLDVDEFNEILEQHVQAASPDLMVHSAALEGWGSVPHLQFQAFAAAAGTHPTTMTDWHHRSALVNRFALVCKGECPKL